MFQLVRSLRRHIRRSGVYIVVLCVLILIVGGAGFWLLDPRISSLGDGLWLAFTTAATVGYGDLVPSTPASRLFAVLVFALGLAVLSLLTATLSAAFMDPEGDREPHCSNEDLMREIQALRQEVAALREQQAQASTTPPV